MIWSDEWSAIRAAAMRRGIDPYFVAAIRKTENGGPGREFGIVSIPAPTFAEQLRVCCNTVLHFLQSLRPKMTLFQPALGATRYAYDEAWIGAFANHYAPPNVANDPRGLNSNWLKNCLAWYAKGQVEFPAI